MRYLKSICAALLALLILYEGICFYTGNFSEEAIKSSAPLQGASPLLPTAEIERRLQQPFYYLSRGHQTYAFIGSDGKTVIKFFNFSQLQLPFWLRMLPSVGPIAKYQQKRTKSLQHRFDRLFRGHQVAEQSPAEFYGLIYQHLRETEGYFPQPLDVVDAIGVHRAIPLDSIVFVVQEKAVIAREMFGKLLAADDIKGAKSRIDQLYALYLSEYKQGLMDKDPNVVDNVGFVRNQAIRIDVGRLQENLDEPIDSYLAQKINNRLLRWIGKYFPSHEEEIKEYLEQMLASYSRI